MRDEGLQEAIRAAGSVSELARRIGISQPSVSSWDRIPAERVIPIESATGVDRTVLRPDLFEPSNSAVDETDLARAQEYFLLSVLLSRAPDESMLKKISSLRGDFTPLGVAHAALSEAAAVATVESVEREFFNLFIGIGRGEILPYGSYYLTGFLHDRPLARLRDDLNAIGIERAQGEYEPEDHAGILCEIMAGLASGQLDAPKGSDRIIFEKHMAPWIGRLFTDMERNEGAKFYRHVGTLGRTLVEIETEAFALPS
jgi:TorA maturation chaperone TorD